MFPILNIAAALPWRFIAAGALASALFVGGCRYGEGRVTARWDAEKLATAQAVAKQAAQVAAVTTHQTTINQGVSNDYQTAKAAIAADRPHLLARVPRRVRDDTPKRTGPLPEIPAVAAGADAAAADPVLASTQPETASTCEKLAEDAAQTTLMVVEFQRWYGEQAKEFGAPAE